jgi:uncharacterized protein
MKNIKIVQRLYELFAAKDYLGIREIFDQSIKWNQMAGFPGGGRYLGADEVFDEVFYKFSRDWTIWKVTITRYIQADEGVFVIGYYEGTYAATGRYMKADFACEYRIFEGKVIEFNQFADTFLIAKAMDLTK